jgi:hypothetical protein
MNASPVTTQNFNIVSFQKIFLFFFNPYIGVSGEERDKEISERDWGNPRQDLNRHPSIKRGFLPPPADKPTPYPPKISSDRHPWGNPGKGDVGSKTTCGRLIGYSRHEPGAF